MAASFGIEAAVLISAQSILQGAAEIAAGVSAAEQQAAATRRQRRDARQQMRAAQQAGIEKRLRVVEETGARLNRLLEVWQSLGLGDAGITLSAAPENATAQALDDYNATLQSHIAQLEARLQSASATLAEDARNDFSALLAAGVSAQEQLATLLARARLAGTPTDTAAVRQALVARVLERLELAEAEPLPAAIDRLAATLMQASTSERAEALATELRYQVQQHNEARAAAEREKSALAGRRQMEEAAAVVLEQSLKDLGYAVEEIDETLFVEGGVAHFQRSEWGDYYIRLRIDPKRQAMNFNVVRTGTTGEDRKHEDMLAEERWCSAFPHLFDTLKARGIPISVNRLLQAGEAPVQVVDASSLPARQTEEERQHASLKARSMT